MPFKSEKQRRYLHANHPDIAKRWEQEYSGGGIARMGYANGTFDPYFSLDSTFDVEEDDTNSGILSNQDSVLGVPNFIPNEATSPLVVDPGIAALIQQQQLEGDENDVYPEEPQNRLSKFLNMKSFNKFAMPAYNFARGNLGTGILGAVAGGPLGILAAMFGGQSFKNRRRAKEQSRIDAIEKAERAYQKSKTVAPKPYVAPLGPRGNGGNQGNNNSGSSKGKSPSDAPGTPF